MKQLLLLIGAAALATSGAALAKPGHANGHGKPQHAKVHDGDRGHWGYGIGGCPPGLAKKTPACVPPGQAKKLFALGQRVPFGYRGLMGYDALPYDLRSRYGYGLDPYGRYIYDNNYLYQVDPTTYVVSRILSAIL